METKIKKTKMYIAVKNLYESYETQLTSTRQADILINEFKKFMFEKETIQLNIDFGGIDFLSNNFINLVFGVTEILYPNIKLNCINNEKINKEVKKVLNIFRKNIGV